jgi:RimJ/RimL family protein N-acetyltransferase
MISFEPRTDPRPDDVVWPVASWPPPASTRLTGTWIELSPTTPDDIAGLRGALDHEEVHRHIAGGPVPDDAAMRGWYDAVIGRDWHPWTVRLRQDVGERSAGSVVGWSSYLEIAPNDARLEIGNTAYDPGVWATQVNPEAKLLLLGYAFDELGMGRVQLKTDIRNERSQRAIAKLGAQFEGVLRRCQRRADGTVRDTVLFSITAEEWPGVRAGLTDRLSAYGGSA